MGLLSIQEAVAALEDHVPNPSAGLPEDLFYFVSRTTPMVNVDLLIKDEDGRTLLSWRDDRHTGTGWHLPGGIIRFKEKLETRVGQVAKTEIGTPVTFKPVPLAINEIIHGTKRIRGHFISILYDCFLSKSFIPGNEGLSRKDPGFLMWHGSCPGDLLVYHEIYRKFL
jgi:colanic acid biosynthesis protein WcaH